MEFWDPGGQKPQRSGSTVRKEGKIHGKVPWKLHEMGSHLV